VGGHDFVTTRIDDLDDNTLVGTDGKREIRSAGKRFEAAGINDTTEGFSKHLPCGPDQNCDNQIPFPARKRQAITGVAPKSSHGISYLGETCASLGGPAR
jgi:hypothetical protein